MQGTDLEAIVLLLELSAIDLTPEADTRFTFQQLLDNARNIGGDEIVLDERDVRIVMPFMGKVIKKLPGGFLCLA